MGTPSLGFALEEPVHVNIWKTKLDEIGLDVGPWLRDLKRAIAGRHARDHTDQGITPDWGTQ